MRPLPSSRRRGNKYNVSPAPDRTYNGVVYHSKREMQYAMELDIRAKERGPSRVVKWARQVSVPLSINGTHICNYVVDFYIETLDGKREYHEIKGFETEEWKLKKKMFEALYPEKKLVVVK